MLNSSRVSIIGIVRTPFVNPAVCPIQSAFSDAAGTVEVFPEFRDGLAGIGSFTHIWLVYLFDRSGKAALRQRPLLDKRHRGVFSIRSPHRPSHLGISVVRLRSVRRGILRVEQVDMLDGSPLLDIKPYVPLFDARNEANSGWLGFQTSGKRIAEA